MISDILADIRYGARAVFSRPTFATIVVLTLALGIGATTAIFGVVNAVLLKPLPYANPDRLVQIFETVPAGELPGFNFPVRTGLRTGELDEWRKAETLSQVAMTALQEGRLRTADDGTVRLDGAAVSPALFAMRGVQPLLGRGLLPQEERPDADVIVLSEAVWREHFGADPGLVGRAVRLDDRALTVVGVMPAQFGSESYWTPFFAPPSRGRPFTSAPTFARLRDGVSLEAAAAEINALGLALRGTTPEPGAPPRFEVVRQLDETTARVVPALRVLVVAVAAVLLIVCTNVANLLLVRGTQRQHEIAIRRSLGATRGRIVRLVLAESLTLAAVAGLLGAGLAMGAVQWLKATAIVDLPRKFQVGAAILPRAAEIAIDPSVLFFVGGLVVVTGALFGVLPALRLSRFGESGHNAAAQLSAAGNTRLGHALATVQLAFAMTLLIGAGLLLNSFLKLAAVDPGFDARSLLTFELVTPANATAERKLEIAEALAARLRADPRVTEVGFVDLPTLRGPGRWLMANFVPQGMTAADVQAAEQALPFLQRSGTRTVSAGYLRALGARLVDGAWLPDRPSPADFAVLVSRPYAERYFPGRRAVGATLTTAAGAPAAAGRTATIVGVVDDIHLGTLDGAPESVVFMAAAQALPAERSPLFDRLFLTAGGSGITFAARIDGDPLAIVPDLRAIARDIDPALAVDYAIPMEAVLSGVTTRPRFYASLLSAFGAIAGFVAVIGIYGVLAYVVSQRTREIGVRMALGAQRANVLKLVLRRGVTMITIGVTAGVLGAFGLTRYLTSMLYGITALDATTYVVVAGAFAAVALLASYLPARRATRVDPVTVLRYE